MVFVVVMVLQMAHVTVLVTQKIVVVTVVVMEPVVYQTSFHLLIQVMVL